MSDEYKVLEVALMQDVASRKMCLFELYRESREHRRKDDLCIYDFLKLNELASKDLVRYCSILEGTSHVSTAYTLINILSGDWMYGKLNRDYDRFVAMAGERCLKLLIESLVENFCNPRDISQDNEAAIYRILDLRDDLRPMLLLGTASDLIYETCGALQPRKVGEDEVESIRGRKIALLERITTKYKSDILRISEDDIRKFFGYEDRWSDDEYRNARETGKSLGFNEGCAAALMTIRQFDISIPKREFSKLIVGALQFNSLASVWKVDNQSVLSVYLADSLVEGCDEQLIVDIVLEGLVAALYRQSHSYYLGNSESTRVADMYLWMLPDLVARLADKGDYALARRIFDRGWNDCLTALYSWVLPVTPLHVIQLLFYYRVFKLRSHEGDGCAKLIEDLPQVCISNGQWVKIEDACLGTIRRNCINPQDLQEISPDIYDLIVNS